MSVEVLLSAQQLNRGANSANANNCNSVERIVPKQLLLFSLSSHLSELVQTHNSKKDKQNNTIDTSTYVLDSIDIVN